MSSVAINASCPYTGTFYACTSGKRFMGCCRSDPCDQGCPSADLRPARIAPDQVGTFPDQKCGGGLFYTCSNTRGYIGCCTSDACVDLGCPGPAIRPAFLSDSAQDALPFVQLNRTLEQSHSTSLSTSSAHTSTSTSLPISIKTTSTSNPTSTKTISTSSSTRAVSPSALPTTRHPSTNSSKGPNVGAIVGGIFVGLILLALLISGALWFIRRRSKPTRQRVITRPLVQNSDNYNMSEFLGGRSSANGSTGNVLYKPQQHRAELSSPYEIYALGSLPPSAILKPSHPSTHPAALWTQLPHDQHVVHELPSAELDQTQHQQWSYPNKEDKSNRAGYI